MSVPPASVTVSNVPSRLMFSATRFAPVLIETMESLVRLPTSITTSEPARIKAPSVEAVPSVQVLPTPNVSVFTVPPVTVRVESDRPLEAMLRLPAVWL